MRSRDIMATSQSSILDLIDISLMTHPIISHHRNIIMICMFMWMGGGRGMGGWKWRMSNDAQWDVRMMG